MRAAILLTLLALLAAPAPAQAQVTVRAGMTLDEVVQRLGQPTRTRSAGDWRYLFYGNDCMPRCGSDDVVFLHRGEVVSAVLRDSRRHYAGPGTDRALPPLAGAAAGMPQRDARLLGTPVGSGVPAGTATPVGAAAPPGEGDPAVVQGIRVTVPGEGAPRGAVQIVPIPADTLGVPPEQRRRERAIEPRTVEPDTAAQRQRARERRVEPRTTGTP
jgi:hypothetical protein